MFRASPLALLLLAACLGLSTAQGPNKCVPIGGPLLSICKSELDYLTKTYPLNSPEVATDQQVKCSLEISQVKDIVAGLPSGLPSSACCAQAVKFDDAQCACDATLPNLLQSVGVQTSSPGLVGVVKITGVACKFTPKPC